MKPFVTSAILFSYAANFVVQYLKKVNVTVMWSKGSEVSILNFILICKYFVFPCILYLAQVKLIFYEFGT